VSGGVLLEPLERLAHLVLGLGAAHPLGALDRLMSRMCSSRGSVEGTQRTLSSPPASSVMRNIPMARHLMRQPGKVGSCRMTIASSGSPSRPRVFSMKP
jgi:hypothetical protein